MVTLVGISWGDTAFTIAVWIIVAALIVSLALVIAKFVRKRN